jgi:RNA polymerase sigma-70 factor (ECF subfamily)
MTPSTATSRPLTAREVDDRELMTKMAAGSIDAFEAIYDRYCDRAYRVARTVCYDSGHAEDAVQDGFLSIWRSRGGYEAEKGTVAAWVLTLVRRRAIDVAVANERHLVRCAEDDRPDRRSGEDVFESAVAHETAQLLQASLATLPGAQAEVIALAFYGQLSHTEIAVQLGLPAGTVKGRMRLGMQKLRATVQQQTSPHVPSK